jgi:hypothetical protein
MTNYIRAISRRAAEIESVDGKDLSWEEFIAHTQPSSATTATSASDERKQDFLSKISISHHIFLVDVDEALSILIHRLQVRQLQVENEIKQLFTTDNGNREVKSSSIILSKADLSFV